MANVAPLPFEPQASGHRAENLLLADSGLVVEGIVETDTISQDAIDYVFKPHPSDSERLAGQNTHTAPWYRRATPWFLFPVIIFSNTMSSRSCLRKAQPIQHYRRFRQ
ncbi:hypothetical protein FRB93_004758 [Tulasnella sp. JGI-2019a]|nr:hypothetical protein FRB93_004758 [Tulasnella sp. JGI-2019a]